MKNKTKTILFTSLIAAMILPFSGIQQANADHPNTDVWSTDIENLIFNHH